MTGQTPSFPDLEQQIIARALKDPRFRDQLVLPLRPAVPDAAEELTEADLANVAGGGPTTLCGGAPGDG